MSVTELRPAQNPDNVLDSAKGLEHALVLGYDKDGAVYIAADTGMDDDNVLALIERAKFILLYESVDEA